MSFGVDVNLLVYATNRDSRHHDAASALLRDWVAGTETLYVPWVAAMAYVRVVTDPRILRTPLPPGRAVENLEALWRVPHVRPLGENDRFWATYRRLSGGQPVRGKLVPDAHLAAVLLAHGVKRLVTNDRDFRRFEELDAVYPLSG